jgi:hypothetical protein
LTLGQGFVKELEKRGTFPRIIACVFIDTSAKKMWTNGTRHVFQFQQSLTKLLGRSRKNLRSPEVDFDSLRHGHHVYSRKHGRIWTTCITPFVYEKKMWRLNEGAEKAEPFLSGRARQLGDTSVIKAAKNVEVNKKRSDHLPDINRSRRNKNPIKKQSWFWPYNSCVWLKRPFIQQSKNSQHTVTLITLIGYPCNKRSSLVDLRWGLWEKQDFS